MRHLDNLKSKVNTLKKIKEGSIFSGVCKGIAQVFQIDAGIVRLFFAGLSLINGLGLFIYLFLHFILDET